MIIGFQYIYNILYTNKYAGILLSEAIWSYTKGSSLNRLIPQREVDKKPGSDRLDGPKALDPNRCRQRTLWLYVICQEVLCPSDKAAEGTTYSVFGNN